MVDDKTHDFFGDKEILVTDVIVRMMSDNSQKVEKIIFETGIGTISYRPVIERFSYDGDGLKVCVKDLCLKHELPEIIRVISRARHQNQVCKVKASYMVWYQERDGEPFNVRYVRGLKMLNKWQVLGSGVNNSFSGVNV